MFLEKNLSRRKKGNLVLQFVILIIIAAIMIFVVTAFGAKIWNAFFPSTDKSTIASFESLYTLMQAKSLSNKDYDSSRLTLYLKGGYAVVYFDSGETGYVCGMWGTVAVPIYKPDKCAKDKSCLCLYNGAPASGSLSSSDRNNNVERCETFDETKGKIVIEDFNLVSYDSKKGSCVYNNDKQYQTLIISEEKDSGSSNSASGSSSNVLHVWLANADNVARDAYLSKPLCKNTIPANSVCKGLRDGDIAGPARDKTGAITYYASYITQYSAVNTECKSTNADSKVYQAMCVYDVASQTCSLDCTASSADTVSVDCSKITSCSDYAGYYGGGTSVQYMTVHSPAYAMCVNSDPCNVNKGKGCVQTLSSHYACTQSSTGEATTDSSSGDCVFPSCNTRYFFAEGFTKFVKNYDKTTCAPGSDSQNLISKYFNNDDSMYVCRGSYSQEECTNALVSKYTVGCNFKKINDESGAIIVDYKNSKDSKCEDALSTYYEPIYFCEDPNYDYNVVSIALDQSMLNGICALSASSNGVGAGPTYDCKKQKITLDIGVQNTGDYPVAVSANPKIYVGGIETSYYSTGSDVSLPIGNSIVTIPVTVDISSAKMGVKYNIYAGAHCSDAVCLSKNIEYKYSNDISEEIILNPAS